MLKVSSREDKVMLQSEWFQDRNAAVKSLLDEMESRLKFIGIKLSGKLKAPEQKVIRFLDTPEFTLGRNGFVLRRRDLKGTDKSQLTLKVRSSDRYFAQGIDLSHNTDFQAKEKLAEDIAAVFHSTLALISQYHRPYLTVPLTSSNDVGSLGHIGSCSWNAAAL